MKKLLLFAVVGIALCVSCDKNTPAPVCSSCEKEAEKETETEEITSLEGTTWVYTRSENDEGELKVELAFTATHATLTQTYSWGKKTFTGTYTFDPPVVLISENFVIDDGVPVRLIHEGTIQGDTMEIKIWNTFDVVMITSLKLQ